MRVIYRNVHYEMLFILFLYAMFCCKRASCCYLLVLIRTWRFVIFVPFNLCILWAWALHVFCFMPCHLSSGVCFVFLWSLWWLAQACKQGFVMLLILVPVLLLFWCHVNMLLQWDPCIFWDTSVRLFWTYGYALSIPALGCNYGVV